MNFDYTPNEDFNRELQFLTLSSFWLPEWIPTIAPSAWLEHGPFAFWLTQTHRPTSVVELGSHSGYSYMAFCQAVKAHKITSRCYAIDTWQGDDHTKSYGEDIFKSVQHHNAENYSDFSKLIRSTFDQACGLFADKTIDLLHIDGYHTYEAVKHDFDTWTPKLSSRGIVLFHDTNVRTGDFGVWKLWEEAALKYPHFEFLHGHGLGVLGVGDKLSQPLRNLLSLKNNSETGSNIRRIYSHLGSAVSNKAQLLAINERRNRRKGWYKRIFKIRQAGSVTPH